MGPKHRQKNKIRPDRTEITIQELPQAPANGGEPLIARLLEVTAKEEHEQPEHSFRRWLPGTGDFRSLLQDFRKPAQHGVPEHGETDDEK